MSATFSKAKSGFWSAVSGIGVISVTSALAAPVIFNYSSSARPGNVVTLQGSDFGNAPTVKLLGQPGGELTLPALNQVNNWIEVQLPYAATGALQLAVASETGVSASVSMNAPKPYHIDALQIVPGGVFRIFGRNLQLSVTPTVTVDGKSAVVMKGGNEHMLTVTAPTGLVANNASVIQVSSNTGSATLDQTVQTITGAGISGDPFALSVGWTAEFSPLLSRTAAVTCANNAADITTIQNAINGLGSAGGVVNLAAGTCLISASGAIPSVYLNSNTILQGAGKDVTTLAYTTNYPVRAQGSDLIALRNLTLTNSGAIEGPIIQHNSRMVLQNVKMNLGNAHQAFMDTNQGLVVSDCEFIQTGSLDQQSPYLFDDSSGVYFVNNQTTFVGGAPSFERIRYAYLNGNSFTRNAANTTNSNPPGTIHMFTMDFATRLAFIGNSFNVTNQVLTDALNRNDGEGILTEGGGAARTENLGTVQSATANTLTDTTVTLNTDPFQTGTLPVNYGVAIVGGTGAGQTRYMTAYDSSTHVLTVDLPWSVVPDTTSKYATFVWALEKSIIKNNTLTGVPRGIWLYQSAMRDVDVVGNTMINSGGIYLRSYQDLATKMFDPIYNVRIAGNTVNNTNHTWPAYLNAIFVNQDSNDFGTAISGIEIRGNTLVTNQPNLNLSDQEYANQDGYFNMMRVEDNTHYQSSTTPRVLGTVFQNDTCNYCNVQYTVGTGAGGTTIIGEKSISSPVLWADWATTITPEKSTNTVLK